MIYFIFYLYMKFNSNSIFQIVIICIIVFCFKDEVKSNILLISPILIGTTWIAFSFTKDILNSIIMGLLLSYILLTFLYKNYEKK